ncbi:hypothetical protein MANES_16G083700v8 [Manihot esculenta]|uniref:VQ domain-containing protein n=1 Tax=Manihot esculenta TaxID=3983 RepID=A0A2C9UAZ2_MANES|nr:hypothetical protein MANES_16G083700v8 [Manihot esculenta]
MGKKQSKASSKISNNEKKQLNSWIKVLRPKVYITDSSSFKSLVQELTGNETTTTTTTMTTTISKPQTVEGKLRVTTTSIEDHGDSESSLETSSTFDSSESPNQVLSLPEGPSQSYIEDKGSDDLWVNQEGDLESLLLDIDPHPFYGCFSQIYQEQISIYDYEISGAF